MSGMWRFEELLSSGKLQKIHMTGQKMQKNKARGVGQAGLRSWESPLETLGIRVNSGCRKTPLGIYEGQAGGVWRKGPGGREQELWGSKGWSMGTDRRESSQGMG